MKNLPVLILIGFLCFAGCDTGDGTPGKTEEEPPLLTSINKVIEYLADNDGRPADNPVKLVVRISLGGWGEQLFEAIAQADTFVALDISQCYDTPQVFQRIGTAGNKIVSLVLPEGITRIQDQAFSNQTTLRQITLPQSVTEIGGAAFFNCTSLTLVLCHPTTPPTLGVNAFNGVSGFTIKVPSGSVQQYKSATRWSTHADKIISM